nr:ABC transporter substrate-binding protein [Nonomuraea sp. SYSU D8015]
MVACGSRTSPPTPTPNQPLQPVTVGIMPIPDCVTIPIATARNYFKAEGLQVKTEIVQGGGAAIPSLKSGTLHFAIMNYTAAIVTEAEEPGTLRIVADAYQAAPNTFKLMVPNNSPIRGITDLRGKRIAVATLKSVSTLTTEAVLAIAGLTRKNVHFSKMPLTEMIAALENGTVDAAWLTEPFITSYGTKFGGRTLHDVMSGQTEDWPIAGWAASAEYTKSHPREVAAFQRAMQKAQLDAAEDRQLVASMLPNVIKIDAKTAGIISLGIFPIDLHPGRIQRVADVMQEYDYIESHLDVGPILLPRPA